jgi:hypothetical protein
MTPAGVSLHLRVSFRRRQLSLPSLVVVSRYDPRRFTRYLLSKQWVSETREIALKFPLTASIQAEFNSRAVVSVYQQSSVRRQPVVCRHREDSIFLLLTILSYCNDVERKEKNFFFRLDITLLIYV